MKKRIFTKKEIEDSKNYAKNIMESFSYYKKRFKEIDDVSKKGKGLSQRMDEKDKRGDAEMPDS